MIRVLIVDDHPLVRSGLRLLLEAEEDFEVEDEAGTAEEADPQGAAAQAGHRAPRRRHAGRSGLEAAPEI